VLGLRQPALWVVLARGPLDDDVHRPVSGVLLVVLEHQVTVLDGIMPIASAVICASMRSRKSLAASCTTGRKTGAWASLR
jgi:hypothetical protein